MSEAASPISIAELWDTAETAVLAACEDVPPADRFMIGAGLPGARKPGEWRAAVGPDWDRDGAAFARAGIALANLAAALPLKRKPKDGVREWICTERDPLGDLVVTVRSLPPEDAFVWSCVRLSGIENFIASRRFKGKPRTAWDAACRTRLVRQDVFGGACVIEPGAVWFVEWLEASGAETIFSCEGHPGDFHVVFRGTYELAHAMAGAPNAVVDIFRSGRFPQTGQWRVRLRSEPTTREKRDERLRRLAEALATIPRGAGRPFIDSGIPPAAQPLA
jgi:hypothetical protein